MPRQVSIVIGLALLAAACGGSDSPAAPTAPVRVIQEANVVTTGTLAVDCRPFTGDLVTCSFQGTAQNLGPGCAANLSGTTASYRPGATTPIDSEQWGYGGFLRPNDQVVYKGINLVVPNVTGWLYRTSFVFQNVACP